MNKSKSRNARKRCRLVLTAFAAAGVRVAPFGDGIYFDFTGPVDCEGKLTAFRLLDALPGQARALRRYLERQ